MRSLGRYNWCPETANRGTGTDHTDQFGSLKKNRKPKPTPESSKSQGHREVQNRRQTLYLHNVLSNICPHPEAVSLRRVSCGKKSEQGRKNSGACWKLPRCEGWLFILSCGTGDQSVPSPTEGQRPQPCRVLGALRVMHPRLILLRV